jgi:hypothetical protein
MSPTFNTMYGRPRHSIPISMGNDTALACCCHSMLMILAKNICHLPEAPTIILKLNHPIKIITFKSTTILSLLLLTLSILNF